MSQLELYTYTFSNGKHSSKLALVVNRDFFTQVGITDTYRPFFCRVSASLEYITYSFRKTKPPGMKLKMSPLSGYLQVKPLNIENPDIFEISFTPHVFLKNPILKSEVIKGPRDILLFEKRDRVRVDYQIVDNTIIIKYPWLKPKAQAPQHQSKNGEAAKPERKPFLTIDSAAVERIKTSMIEFADAISEASTNVEAPQLTAPWHHKSFQGWSIVGMNHYYVNGEKRLFVAMATRTGRLIKAEGLDNKALWSELAEQAVGQ